MPTADPGPRVEEMGEFAGLGGRAMTSLIVAKEVDPTCHPLGAANKLVFAPGMLTGSAASTSGRISVGCKSPLTGGIKEANAGGQAGQALARLGYRAVIVEGKPAGDDLWTVLVNKDGVSFKVDNDLRMQGTYDTVEKLKGEYGDKVTFMVIGQAGEMMLGGASIQACDRELHPDAGDGSRRRRGCHGLQEDQGVRPRRGRDEDPPAGRRGALQGRRHDVQRGPPAPRRLRPGPAVLRDERPHQHPQRGRRLPDQQLPDRPFRRRREDLRRDPGRDDDRAGRPGRPTPATAAASSSARASTTTRRAST